MGDDKKKDESAPEWGTALDGADAPAVGVNQEIMRKALELNPNLKKGKRTIEVIQEVSEAQAKRTVASLVEGGDGKQKPKDTAPRDFVNYVLSSKKKLAEERARLQREIAALQKQEKELAPSIGVRLIEAALELDPNLVSPQTIEIIKMEQAFLTEVGFSARKVIERKMAKQSGK